MLVGHVGRGVRDVAAVSKRDLLPVRNGCEDGDSTGQCNLTGVFFCDDDADDTVTLDTYLFCC